MVVQGLGELGTLATLLRVHQVPEPLELVEDHQIGFESFDHARARH